MFPVERVFPVGGDVTRPQVISKVEPDYSEEAREAKLNGTVVLAIEVWPDGRAHNIRVLRSLGLGLDEKAIEAIQQWRFVPGKKDGVPVRVRANIEVNFRIFKSSEISSPKPRSMPSRLTRPSERLTEILRKVEGTYRSVRSYYFDVEVSTNFIREGVSVGSQRSKVRLAGHKPG